MFHDSARDVLCVHGDKRAGESGDEDVALHQQGGGFVTHFLGIGGGLVCVPVLNTILGVPIHQTIALSQATMVISSSVGAATFFILGFIRTVNDLPA